MVEDRTPTDLLVSSCIRRAASEGVAIMLRQKGDPSSGALLLKINYLDGKAQVFSQVRADDEAIWTPRSPQGPMSDAEAEEALREEMGFDPDLWVVEIEDRQGRLWFPGKIEKV